MDKVAVIDAEDIVELKNRKQRRKKLIKLLVIILLAVITVGLYFTRDTWYPKLRGIGKQYKTIVNTGQLATGNFPIELSAGTDYQMRYTVKRVMVLSDTYLYIYDNPITHAIGDVFEPYDDIRIKAYVKDVAASVAINVVTKEDTAASGTGEMLYNCMIRMLHQIVLLQELITFLAHSFYI